MIPDPKTAAESAELCAEIWAVYGGEHKLQGDEAIDLIFCRALRCHIENRIDHEGAGLTDASFRLLNRVGGFFGDRLIDEVAEKAGRLVDELEAIARSETGAPIILSALLSMADREDVVLPEARVVDILLAFKNPQRIKALPESKQPWAASKPLQSHQEHRAALIRLQDIFEVEEGSPEAEELNRLATLIEQYEQEHFPIV